MWEPHLWEPCIWKLSHSISTIQRLGISCCTGMCVFCVHADFVVHDSFISKLYVGTCATSIVGSVVHVIPRLYHVSTGSCRYRSEDFVRPVARHRHWNLPYWVRSYRTNIHRNSTMMLDSNVAIHCLISPIHRSRPCVRLSHYVVLFTKEERGWGNVRTNVCLS